MAERRMFAKTIIDSDAFLDMPLSTQALYFHLSMRADDDGFLNNPKKLTRVIGCNSDDLKLLIAKKFILPFETGVVVIKHWRIHNYIQKDRYKETVYKDEKSLLGIEENGSYTLNSDKAVSSLDTRCIQSVSSLDTQDRLGKDRLGKDRLDKGVNFQEVVDLYNGICRSLPSVRSLSEDRKKSIKARLNRYSIDQLKEAFTKAEASDFMKGANDRSWTATFDWIMKDRNLAKILDGNYDNRSGRKTGFKNRFHNFRQGNDEQYARAEAMLLRN